MQLTETLEELLELFGARITAKSPIDYTVNSTKGLPERIAGIVISTNIEIPYAPQQILGKLTPEHFTTGSASYTYVFPSGSEAALRALLFLATEKERYEKFCKSIDDEITEELGISEKSV